MGGLIPDDIPLLPHEDPTDPYITSGLRTVVGRSMNPLAKRLWYAGERLEQVMSESSPVITAGHPQLAAWLQLFGGLDPWWSAEQPPVEQWPMSRVVPRVKLGPNFPEWPIPVGSYWIDYEAVTSSTTRLPQAERVLELRSRFPEGSQLLLGNIGKIDSRLALWYFRNELWNHPLIEQVDAVVCPDFSSYLDDPFPHGAVGERMTQIFTELGAAHGKTMIPIISWQNRDALRRQADLLGSLYPQVNTVYIELLAREVDKGAWLYSRFDDLQELAHLPMRVLVSGLDAGWSIRVARDMWPGENFHLVSIWPWMKTSFTPGTKAQKARSFRKFIRHFEDFHRGERLPEAKPRPEHMTVLKWQQEEEAKQAADAAAAEAAEAAAEAALRQTAGGIEILPRED